MQTVGRKNIFLPREISHLHSMYSIKKKIGSLKTIDGPMSSGKTSQLVADLTTYADIGMKVLYIAHEIDERKTVSNISNKIASHSSTQKTLSPLVTVIRSSDLSKIDVEPFNVIGVDECLHHKNLVKIMSDWVIGKGKMVICASLSSWHDRKPVTEWSELMGTLATEKMHLKAVCPLCQELFNKIEHNIDLKTADFTFCKNIKKMKNGVLIAGLEDFMPCCLTHHVQLTFERDSKY